MNKFLSIAALCAVAAPCIAGVRVENVTRDIKTKVADGAPQVVQVQDGKIRASRGLEGGMIIKGATIYMLDDKRKQYREMDKESMKKLAGQANAAMTQMQERMKNMTPEQRAMMEKMMGGQMPGGMGGDGKPDVYESKDTGKDDTVEGRKCRIWQINRNGQLLEDMCVVPFSSLPGKEDFEKAFKALAEAFADLASAMPNVDKAVKARTAVNGYPVRIRPYDGTGKLRGTETVLTKWTEESIPAATFDVPAGYTKAELPRMGGK
jgi:hypothetical protein